MASHVSKLLLIGLTPWCDESRRMLGRLPPGYVVESFALDNPKRPLPLSADRVVVGMCCGVAENPRWPSLRDWIAKSKVIRDGLICLDQSHQRATFAELKSWRALSKTLCLGFEEVPISELLPIVFTPPIRHRIKKRRDRRIEPVPDEHRALRLLSEKCLAWIEATPTAVGILEKLRTAILELAFPHGITGTLKKREEPDASINACLDWSVYVAGLCKQSPGQLRELTLSSECYSEALSGFSPAVVALLAALMLASRSEQWGVEQSSEEVCFSFPQIRQDEQNFLELLINALNCKDGIRFKWSQGGLTFCLTLSAD